MLRGDREAGVRGPDEEAEHLRGCVVCPALTGRACSITDLTTPTGPEPKAAGMGVGPCGLPSPERSPPALLG